MNTKVKYTPIKDRLTNEPIFLGDYVENEKGQCGVLIWDDYINRYLIKSIDGGNVYATKYRKVKEISKNNIDCYKVECRRVVNKKKW